MLNVLKKDKNTQSLDFKKINNFLSWTKEEEKKPKWYNIKARWNNLWKKKNTFNPFATKINSSVFDSVLDEILNTTPEEEEERNKRVLEMIKYMAHPYTETQIEENVFKYTHDSDPTNFYYKVHEIKMNPEEYNQYLEKKELNKKLSAKLTQKNPVKAIKI